MDIQSYNVFNFRTSDGWFVGTSPRTRSQRFKGAATTCVDEVTKFYKKGTNDLLEGPMPIQSWSFVDGVLIGGEH